ncbi:MAG: hypothetical protein ACFFDN_36905 [Candidatus Hodarchaeota archaeon]
MNIVNQIINNVKKNENFFSPFLLNKKKRALRSSTLRFLNSTTYRELEDNSRTPRSINYNIHEKTRTLLPLGEIMHRFELYEKYGYKYQRLHFPHLVNVYLLGLFFFHNSSLIHKRLIQKIIKEPNRIFVPELKKRFDFSSEHPEGEFYYRWRLASLCHDFGYPIELLSNDAKKLNLVLEEIDAEISTSILTVDDLYRYNQVDLMSKINDNISNVDLLKYDKYRRENPIFKESIFDHGIYGALLFLNSMYSHFKLYPILIERDDGSRILTSNELLGGSLLTVSSSIALHNIDSHPEALLISVNNHDNQIYNLENDPLSFLLKLCDEIQEWYKFERQEIIVNKLYEEKLEETEMYIDFDGDRIIINNLKNADEVRDKIEEMFNPSKIIQIE